MSIYIIASVMGQLEQMKMTDQRPATGRPNSGHYKSNQPFHLYLIHLTFCFAFLVPGGWTVWCFWDRGTSCLLTSLQLLSNAEVILSCRMSRWSACLMDKGICIKSLVYRNWFCQIRKGVKVWRILSNSTFKQWTNLQRNWFNSHFGQARVP